MDDSGRPFTIQLAADRAIELATRWRSAAAVPTSTASPAITPAVMPPNATLPAAPTVAAPLTTLMPSPTLTAAPNTLVQRLQLEPYKKTNEPIIWFSNFELMTKGMPVADKCLYFINLLQGESIIWPEINTSEDFGILKRIFYREVVDKKSTRELTPRERFTNQVALTNSLTHARLAALRILARDTELEEKETLKILLEEILIALPPNG